MLSTGKAKSCGCLRKEMSSELCKTLNTTHGLSLVNGKPTRLYYTWMGMRERCNNHKATNYERYGGRGIHVCNEWNDNYKAFHDWAYANGYKDNLTIDRIDVNGNYSPENCRWATPKEQARNKRNNMNVTFRGVTKTISEWAEIVSIKKQVLWRRLKVGWDVETALTLQPKRGNSYPNRLYGERMKVNIK